MKHIHQIVFDFDYTLADSSEGIIASVNHALETVGEKKANPDKVRHLIGHSLEDTFAQFVDPADERKIRTCKKLFMEFADTGVMVKNTIILKDVPKTLEWLYENFYAMGIVSTKRRSAIEATLAQADLEDFFDVVFGYEDVKELKPHPEGLLRAVEELGGNTNDTVYVGDSIIDIQTAKNAGIPVIAIASGMTTAEVLQSKSPEVLIRSFGELQKLFNHSTP
ncbi:HAD-IA family hydrolase [bacterium]|nr:HAD-IA family hydrolase [bacterium]